MFTAAEIKAVETQVEAKCDEFELVTDQIIDAGFSGIGANPFFYLNDSEGKPWPKRPDEMSPADIYEFVQHRFGDLFVGFLRSKPVMIVH